MDCRRRLEPRQDPASYGPRPARGNPGLRQPQGPPARARPARRPALLRAGAGDEVREDLDVLLRQRLSRRGHVAVDVGARHRLEAAQLRPEVLELLAGEARDVLLAEEPGAVALR